MKAFIRGTNHKREAKLPSSRHTAVTPSEHLKEDKHSGCYSVISSLMKLITTISNFKKKSLDASNRTIVWFTLCSFFPSLVLHTVYSVYDRKSLHFVTNVALFFFLAEAVKTQWHTQTSCVKKRTRWLPVLYFTHLHPKIQNILVVIAGHSHRINTNVTFGTLNIYFH